MQFMAVALCITFYSITGAQPQHPATPQLNADAPAIVQEYFKICVAQLPAFLREAEQELRLAERELANRQRGRVIVQRADRRQSAQGQWMYPSEADKQAHVAEQQSTVGKIASRVDSIRRGEVLPEVAPYPAGFARELGVTVLQVLGPSDALVRIVRVDDKDQVLKDDIWLTGTSTRGWTDATAEQRINNVFIRVAGPIYRSGTKTYEATSGASRTVPLYKRFVWSDWLEISAAPASQPVSGS